MDLRRLVYANAYQAYMGTLRGNGAPIDKALFEVFTKPRPGHLVMETSTIYMHDRDEHRFGRLLRKASEPMYTREKWAEGGGTDNDPIPSEVVWYIEKPDGTEYRWVNASFIRVLEEPLTSMEAVKKDQDHDPLWRVRGARVNEGHRVGTRPGSE
jgi:hypothetical protein